MIREKLNLVDEAKIPQTEETATTRSKTELEQYCWQTLPFVNFTHCAPLTQSLGVMHFCPMTTSPVGRHVARPVTYVKSET